MEHPFIGDLSSKTLDELQTTINDLSGKMRYVMRTGNQNTINQLSMVIESYKLAYARKIDEVYKKQNLDGKINITKQ